MDLTVERVEILLLVAAVVAVVVRRLRIPYSVGLVIAGGVLSVFGNFPEIGLTKNLVFNIFLPPLVFEAALYIRWVELRKDLAVILTLATVGVLLAAGITTLGMHYLVQWDWASAAVFGILIAATDPVSVIATFNEAGVQGRLRLLVEAESLFNDSTVAIAFSIVVMIAAGGSINGSQIVPSLLLSIIGGIVCGAVFGGGMLLLSGRTVDHLVELTLTTVVAYGSFLVAEHLHFSGVLASLVAGLLIGNVGSFGFISHKGRDTLNTFWEYVAFVVNSLIFILIGIQGTHQMIREVLMPALVAIGLVLVGRAVAIYLCCALFSRSALRVAWSHQHLLFWGGLRGALALALALGLPLEIEHRNEILTIAFAVVTFSLVVQGLTVTPLLRRLGEIKSQAD
ncbi:MAG: sodium:proton antiporter [Chloroflexota bacterium]